VAAGGDIAFIAPASLGDVLVADARARARYGRQGIYDVTVTRGDLLIAEFRGRSHQTGADDRQPPALLAFPPYEATRAKSADNRAGEAVDSSGA
jgi:hypothetical protein